MRRGKKRVKALKYLEKAEREKKILHGVRLVLHGSESLWHGEKSESDMRDRSVCPEEKEIIHKTGQKFFFYGKKRDFSCSSVEKAVENPGKVQFCPDRRCRKGVKSDLISCRERSDGVMREND